MVIPDPFDGLEPIDGFHVITVHGNNGISMHCIVYAGGILTNIHDTNPDNATVEVASWPVETLQAEGECIRLHLVLEAVALYLTTGGELAPLLTALQRMTVVANGNLVFPGYFLMDSYQTTDGGHQCIFVKEGTRDAILWEMPEYSDSGSEVIGGFIDRTDLDTIEKEQIEDVARSEREEEEA